MANVNDSHNTNGKLTNEWVNIGRADIDTRDIKAITRFGFHRRDGENVKLTTLLNDLGNLRRAAERSNTRLLDMTQDDLDRLWRVLTTPKSDGGYGITPGGSGEYGYKRACKRFYRWLDGHPDYGAYTFYDDIELPDLEPETVTDDVTLTEAQVTAMVDAAHHQRDRALIEFFADTGARLSLTAQLRVGDIHNLHGEGPYYTPNDQAINHKGADKAKNPEKLKRPIVNARGELRVYLERAHVDGENPDAPLWHVLRGYDAENPDESALSNDRIADILKECAERAGIEKRVTPHSFRHTALTRLSDIEDDKTEVQRIAGWNHPDMLDLYDHRTAEQMNKRHHERAGYTIDDPEIEDPEPGLIACSSCMEKVRATRRKCHQCGSLLHAEDRYLRTRLHETTVNDMAEPEMPADAREVQRHLLDLMDDGEFIAAVSDRIAAETSDD